MDLLKVIENGLVEEVSMSDIAEPIFLGYTTRKEAFDVLMDKYYCGSEGRNPWVVAEVKGGYYVPMTEREAEQCEDVVEWFVLEFDQDHKTNLYAWSTGQLVDTFKEGE